MRKLYTFLPLTIKGVPDMTEAKKTTNLDELKAKLYEAFDAAIDRANYFSSEGHFEIAATKFLGPASEAAKAITLIEREQREAKERGYNKLDKN